jgi:hypothetical protein
MRGRFSSFTMALACAAMLAAGPAAAATKHAHAGAPAAAGGARAVIGNTVHGFEDDGEYYDYYAPNGTASSLLVNGNDLTHGRWAIHDGNLCISYPDDTPTCYKVEVNSGSVTLTDLSAGTVFPVQIIHGNPKGL